MNLRVFNQKILGPLTMGLMIAGIVFLCQPWVAVLHEWSVLIMLIGLIGFNVSVHIPAPEQDIEQDIEEDDAGPVSVRETVRDGASHG